MTKQPHDKTPDVDPLTVAEDVNAFMQSDLGKRYIEAMEGKYKELHDKSEMQPLTSEERSYYVIKASGVKESMEWFKSRKRAYDSGAYEKK